MPEKTKLPSSQNQPAVLESDEFGTRADFDTLWWWKLNPYRTHAVIVPFTRKSESGVEASVEYPILTQTHANQCADPPTGRFVLAPVVRQVTAEVRSQLTKLGQLVKGWNDESPAPNQTAIFLATRVLDVLDQAAFAPSRVVPDAEGGVSIYFDGTGRYAALSCSNEGEVVALTHDRADAPRVWTVGTDRSETRAAVERIRAFLG